MVPTGTNTIEEGDIYVVYDDWSNISWPGNTYCDSPGSPGTAPTCEVNVAYVWAIGAVGGSDGFVRLGPLTGPVGSTGPYYTDVSISYDKDDGTGFNKYLRLHD